MEPKAIIKSRSLWATALPLVTLGLTTASVDGAEQIAKWIDTTVVAGIAIAAVVLEVLHQRKPQVTKAAKV